MSVVMRRWSGGRKIALATLVGALAGASPAGARVIERVVAVVNDEIILLSEVEQRAAPFAGQLAAVADAEQRKLRRAQLQRQVLEQMVDDKLIEQQARTHKLTVEEADLDRAVQEVMRRNNLTREQLAQALAQEGQSLESYKQQMLRPQLLRLKVLNVQVRARVSVGDDELRALYQHNLRTLDAEAKVQARLLLLALPPAALPQQVASRRALAEQLAKRLAAGADFAQLARQYSDDAATRAKGGDLGTLTRGTLPGKVEDALFVRIPLMPIAQSEGRRSRIPVEGDHGFRSKAIGSERSDAGADG